MLSWALFFFCIALAFGVVGFAGSAFIAKVGFFVCLALTLVALVVDGHRSPH